ncbi:hypothetical protein [Chamaesiphon sp.]|uniref:hypothetical protein n=1 Tax=Chamaesiphon sp. TaxID=2814140 RepID=UPI003593BEEE
MNILLTNIGGDVEFVRNFLDSMQNLGVLGKIIVTNESIAPSSYISESIELTGSIHAPDYIRKLLSICQRHLIQLLIPRDDRELCLLSRHSEQFAKIGVLVLTSSEIVNHICADRINALKFLQRAGVKVLPFHEGIDPIDLAMGFPVVLRSGIDRQIPDRLISDDAELKFHLDRSPTSLYFQPISGDRYEVDCFVNKQGNPISIVPRLQMDLTSEMMQRTVKNLDLIIAAKTVIKALTGAFGNITLECYLDSKGNIYFSDVIPRFSKGCSLIYHAGADFPFYIFEMMAGIIGSDLKENWIDGLNMFSYDNYIYTHKDLLLSEIDNLNTQSYKISTSV